MQAESEQESGSEKKAVNTLETCLIGKSAKPKLKKLESKNKCFTLLRQM